MPRSIYAFDSYFLNNFFLDDIVLQFRSNDSVDERIINLEANSYVRVRSDNVPKNVAFAVVQAHSQINKITMGQERKLAIGNHVNGTSIGIFVDTTSSNSGVIAYLINTLSINVTVLTFILYYDRSGESPTPDYIFCMTCRS